LETFDNKKYSHQARKKMSEVQVDRPLTAEEIAQLSTLEEGGPFASLEQEVRRNPSTGRIIEGPDGPDDKLFVAFSLEPRFSKVDTVRAGAPKYRDTEMITIYMPGQVNNLTVHTEVTEYYKWRFPMEYQAFKSKHNASVVGIPLIHWPEVSPALLKELEYHGIRTVEQVAGLPDNLTGELRGFRGLKAKAQAFLENAQESAAKQELEKRLKEQEGQFKAELDAMRAQIESLLALKALSVDVDEDEEESEAEGKVKKGGNGRFVKKS
jgi:hypothetical protein